MLVAAAATETMAGRTTGLLGKSADGTISPLSFSLLWPYHAGLRAKLALQRRVSTEPAFSQITDDYYIGAWPSEQKLVPTVHPAVLDVTCELPLQVTPPAYLNLAVWDTHAPTVAQIDQGVSWALAQRAAGRKVLVHCAHGHGRSATVLAAILIAEGLAKGPAEAEALMKAERPRVRLNKRQKAALKQFRASSHGSCLLLIMLEAVRRAIQAHSKRKQAELEEEGREQAALEPLSVPADVIVACLSQLTEVSDLAAAGSVSREWRQLAAEADGAWRNAFIRDYGEQKAADVKHLRLWRERYIACRLDSVWHKLRSKARYLDELEDSAGLVEKQTQTLLARLSQMDRTLSHRRHDLNAQLAALSGHRGTHADTQRGQELLELAAAGGDPERCPRLTQEACASLLEMKKDLDYWRTSIAQEKEQLHRLWDSLSYINDCIKRARRDIGQLQQRKAALEQATRWRPNVRRT
ncbi:hypothetical protein COHA_005909 [Chlorella ohadii]|uniref:Tyrosine specific protein phosphatases domain-containing protein n=1 Tax=Chlorella ohadii TaxID=2649997 RepID=A0AAD5H4X5_9CHLO|nr:hypothetical protein COHA_005909 [Chlorella ohadii]